jgi:hypothetical protein
MNENVDTPTVLAIVAAHELQGSVQKCTSRLMPPWGHVHFLDHHKETRQFLGVFAKLRKPTVSFFVSVRIEQLRLPVDGC